MSRAYLTKQLVMLMLTLGVGVCIGLSVEWPNKDEMTPEGVDAQTDTKPVSQAKRENLRTDAARSGAGASISERARSRNSIGRTPRTMIRSFYKDYKTSPYLDTNFNKFAQAYEAIRIMNPEEINIALEELSRINADGHPEYPASHELRAILLKQLPEERAGREE